MCGGAQSDLSEGADSAISRVPLTLLAAGADASVTRNCRVADTTEPTGNGSDTFGSRSRNSVWGTPQDGAQSTYTILALTSVFALSAPTESVLHEYFTTRSGGRHSSTAVSCRVSPWSRTRRVASISLPARAEPSERTAHSTKRNCTTNTSAAGRSRSPREAQAFRARVDRLSPYRGRSRARGCRGAGETVDEARGLDVLVRGGAEVQARPWTRRAASTFSAAGMLARPSVRRAAWRIRCSRTPPRAGRRGARRAGAPRLSSPGRTRREGSSSGRRPAGSPP